MTRLHYMCTATESRDLVCVCTLLTVRTLLYCISAALALRMSPHEPLKGIESDVTARGSPLFPPQTNSAHSNFERFPAGETNVLLLTAVQLLFMRRLQHVLHAFQRRRRRHIGGSHRACHTGCRWCWRGWRRHRQVCGVQVRWEELKSQLAPDAVRVVRRVMTAGRVIRRVITWHQSD